MAKEIWENKAIVTDACIRDKLWTCVGMYTIRDKLWTLQTKDRLGLDLDMILHASVSRVVSTRDACRDIGNLFIFSLWWGYAWGMMEPQCHC
jgi:hypothetical protein